MVLYEHIHITGEKEQAFAGGFSFFFLYELCLAPRTGTGIELAKRGD